MFCNYPVTYFTNIDRMPSIIQCSRIFLCFRIYLFKIYLKNIIFSILTFSVHFFFTISPNPVCLMNEKKTEMPPFPFISIFEGLRASLVAQRVKRLPTMQEIWVWSLGQEDPMEKEMETHYIIIKNKPTGRKQEKKLYEQKRSSQMLASCRRWSSQGQTTDQNSLKSIGLSLTVGCLWRPTWPTRIYANVSEFQLFGVLTV